jgi:starvation-inducible DNA-binding protein
MKSERTKRITHRKRSHEKVEGIEETQVRRKSTHAKKLEKVGGAQATKKSGKRISRRKKILAARKRVVRSAPKNAQPILGQRGREAQPYDTLVHYPLGISARAKVDNVTTLNELLARTMALRDMYKKSHWQVSGPTFYQLHLLFDKHYQEQVELMDLVAERIQTLGGVTIAMPRDVARVARSPRAKLGREQVPVELSRLVEAHARIISVARAIARQAAQNGDDATNNIIASNVLPVNEMQVWFLSEHLVDTAVVKVEKTHPSMTRKRSTKKGTKVAHAKIGHRRTKVGRTQISREKVGGRRLLNR